MRRQPEEFLKNPGYSRDYPPCKPLLAFPLSPNRERGPG
jgi:hypothetical protein